MLRAGQFSIGLGLVTLSESLSSSDTLTTTSRISFNVPTTSTPDFDGDGMVGFSDFLAFAGRYGARRGDSRYQAKYDLNSDGAIDFRDFLSFAGSYGSPVPPPPPPGGGSSGPDLIVESPSVSDSTLTPGQSFTLRATVRNRGTGQSASTTLTYYRSSNSTISTSDTEVGTDSVSGLSASGTGSESISLTAPSSTGTYYYGACVASVSGESNTNNNCSDGVRVTVIGGVAIPDARLRAAISGALNKARGAPITRADMETLRSRFDATASSINNLTGLEFATNLGRLSLAYNQISDIAPLAGLTNLRVLSLAYNQYISDITALAGLTNLTWLSLHLNQISDIAALSGLTNLTYLDLDLNQISDLSALSGLTKLTTLELSSNQISDLAALSGLTKLTELYLRYNQISDLAALSGLTNLRTLDLRGNPLSATSINTHIPALRARGVAVHAGSDDHSNTRSGATSLSLGGSRSGRIETGGDVDYFRVQVSSSGTLTVYTTGNTDTYGTVAKQFRHHFGNR